MARIAACVLGLGLMVSTAPAWAQSYNYVSPHMRSDGTQVQGHYRTNPNSSMNDNWTTRGNTNPFTGQQGYRDPSPSYGSSGSSYGGSRSYGNTYNPYR